MSTIPETAQTGQARRRTTIDGWQWGGRVFLLVMLLYTALPMVWMLLTSIKSGFAAMQFRPNGGRTNPLLPATKSCSIRKTASAKTSCVSFGTACSCPRRPQ